MAVARKSGMFQGQNEANITPLADVTTTLIVVFLITMPAIMWNGIQVNQAEAGTENAQVQPTQVHDDKLVTVEVQPEGLRLDGRAVTAAELDAELPALLREREDRTVVIIPHDDVSLGRVVEALDIAKASGAEGLALLNRIGGDQ
ncbi:MAG: biopolymer transporter ExbD [Candidatus Krumholzibacteriia bacterium]